MPRLRHVHIGNTDFHEIQCEQCYTLWLVTARQNPGFADWEDVRCALCGADLGEIRADLGHTMAALALIRQLGEQAWLNVKKGKDGRLHVQLLRGPDGDDLVEEFSCELDELRDQLLAKGVSAQVAEDLVQQRYVLRAG
jgi:hypothetical protein